MLMKVKEKKRVRRDNPEERLQRTIHQVLSLHPRKIDFVHFAIPNGERRDIQTGARLKQMGVLAGVADIAIVVPGGIIYFLEIKSEKGRQSAAQKAFEKKVRGMGAVYEVVHSIDEAMALFKKWGLI